MIYVVATAAQAQLKRLEQEMVSDLKDKVVLVTDAAHVGTSEGGLFGSSISLSDAVRNVVNWQVSNFPEAIRMATLNPAACMGWSSKIGQLESGNCADIVVWDQASLAIRKVYVNGELKYDGS